MNICLLLSIMIILAVCTSTVTGANTTDTSIIIEESNEYASTDFYPEITNSDNTSTDFYPELNMTNLEILDNFENLNLWKLEGLNLSYITFDTINFKEGKRGLKLVAINGDKVYATLKINKDFSNTKNFTFGVYIYNTTTIGYITFYFTSRIDWSKYFSYTINRPFIDGWNNFIIKKSDINNYGGEDWNNTMIMFRLSVFPITGKDTNVTIDNFRHDISERAKVISAIDDGTKNNSYKNDPSRMPGFNNVELIMVLIILIIYNGRKTNFDKK